jgi:hypothetical protein
VTCRRATGLHFCARIKIQPATGFRPSPMLELALRFSENCLIKCQLYAHAFGGFSCPFVSVDFVQRYPECLLGDFLQTTISFIWIGYLEPIYTYIDVYFPTLVSLHVQRTSI